MAAVGAFAEATASVDLSNLITFNPTALELTLKGILGRLANLEKEKPAVPPAGGNDASAPSADSHAKTPVESAPSDRGLKGTGAAQPLEEKKDKESAGAPLGKRGSGSLGGSTTGVPLATASPKADAAAVNDRIADLQRQIDELAARLPKGGTGPFTSAQAPPQAAGSEQATAVPASGAPKAAANDSGTGGPATAAGLIGDIPANLSHRLARLEDAAEEAKKGKQETDARLAELRDAMDVAHEDLEALQKKVDGLTGRADELESGLTRTDQGLADAKGTIDSHTEEIAALRRDTGKLQGRLGTLEGLTTLLNSDRDVGSDLKSFSETLGDLRAAQLAARADIDAAKNDLDGVKAGVRELATQAAAKDKGRDAQLEELSDKLGNLGSSLARAEQGVQNAATKSSLDSLEHRLDGVERQAEALARQSHPPAAAASTTTAPVAAAAPAATAAPTVAGGGVPPAHLAALTGRVDDLTKQVSGMQSTLDAFRGESRKETKGLRDHVDGHKSEIAALGNECSRMSADLSKRLLEWRKVEEQKASKQDLDALKQWVLQQLPRDDSGALQALKDQLLDVVGRQAEQQRGLHELKSAVRETQAAANALANEKAGKDLVGHLSVDVADLANRLKDLNVNRPMQLQTAKAADEALQGLQSTISQAVVMAAQDRDWTKTQILEIRATVEHIHHSKADANLVANKAERDYVENAMEKLMREVEQVLNTTNSGLIDTIDKSLNILRDMIDGKATKDDVNQLKRGIAASAEGADGNGTVPDGLMGYKGFRCLGCNRTMDGMRARPIGSSFSAFLNRVPASPRMPRPPALLSASPTGGASVTAGSNVGYLTAPPGSA